MRALFVTVDAGGNLRRRWASPPRSCGAAAPPRFLGHAPQRAAIERAGFAFDAVKEGCPYDSAEPRGTLSGPRDLTAVFADRGIGADALRLARAEAADVVIVGCLLLGAIDVLVRAGVPTASLVHTLWSFISGEARGHAVAGAAAGAGRSQHDPVPRAGRGAATDPGRGRSARRRGNRHHRAVD